MKSWLRFPSKSLYCILFLLLIILYICPCIGMIVNNDAVSISSDDQFTSIKSFEYADGGSIRFSISILSSARNSSLQVLLCSDAVIDTLRGVSFSTVCNSPIFNYVRCDWQTALGLQYSKLSVDGQYVVVDSEDWYRLYILNCEAADFSLELSYSAINPNGEFLSMSEVPYKNLYFAWLLIWSAFCAFWFLHLLRYRTWNITLQKLLSLLPLMRALLEIPNLWYWRSASLTGYYSMPLFLLSWVCAFIERGIFFYVLVAAAKGYGYLYAKLNDSINVAGIIALWVTSYAVYTFFSGYFLFFLVIVYVLMLRFIFAATVANITVLAAQARMLASMDFDASTTPLWQKLLIVRQFQMSVVAYVSLDIISHLWSIIFLNETPWIEALLEDIICFCMLLFCFQVFSLRPFDPYFVFKVLAAKNDENANSQRSSNADENAEELPRLQDDEEPQSVSQQGRYENDNRHDNGERSHRSVLPAVSMEHSVNHAISSGPHAASEEKHSVASSISLYSSSSSKSIVSSTDGVWNVGDLWNPASQYFPPIPNLSATPVLQQLLDEGGGQTDDSNGPPVLIIQNPAGKSAGGAVAADLSLGVPLRQPRPPDPLDEFLNQVRKGRILFDAKQHLL